MTKIVVLGRFGGVTDGLPELLKGDEVFVPGNDADLSGAADAEIGVGTNQGERVAALLRAAPKLRWYHTPAAGVDQLVRIGDFRARGIRLTNNSGSYDIQIAEHVMAFVLAAGKRLHLYRDQQARHEWADHTHEELRDETMVVFGAGSIGGEIVRLASAFGMRVIAVRRSGGAVHGAQRVVTPDRLAEVAAEADHLVVAVPLTPQTQGAISRDVLAKMKRTAWVHNIARGPIVDEAALIEALSAGRIGGAALDTFVEEPLPATSPLWSRPNVIVTPHASNSSPKLRERTLALFLENLRRYKAGEPLLNVVALDAGY